MLNCYKTLANFYLADSLINDALSLYERVFYSLKKIAYTYPSVNGENYTDALMKLVEINALIVKKEERNPLKQNIASWHIDSLLVEFLNFQKQYVLACDSMMHNKEGYNKRMNEAYTDLGWAYLFNKKPKKAEDATRIAIDLKADNTSQWCLLFSLLSQNDKKLEKEAKIIFQSITDGSDEKDVIKSIAFWTGKLEETKCVDSVKMNKKLKNWLPVFKDTASK